MVDFLAESHDGHCQLHSGHMQQHWRSRKTSRIHQWTLQFDSIDQERRPGIGKQSRFGFDWNSRRDPGNHSRGRYCFQYWRKVKGKWKPWLKKKNCQEKVSKLKNMILWKLLRAVAKLTNSNFEMQSFSNFPIFFSPNEIKISPRQL